jgi:hypothetical protein
MTMTEHKLFTCPECGGDVEVATGPGRTMQYQRSVPEFPIPDDFELPTCKECGETFVPADKERELEDHLRGEYRAWQPPYVTRLVKLIMDRHGATLRQVAGIMGVTVADLDDVRTGRLGRFSLAALRLLECVAMSPFLFAHYRDGKLVGDYGVVSVDMSEFSIGSGNEEQGQ